MIQNDLFDSVLAAIFFKSSIFYNKERYRYEKLAKLASIFTVVFPPSYFAKVSEIILGLPLT